MKKILINLFIVSIAVFTSMAFSQSTSKELNDPVIQHIELTLDLVNSSNKIVSALSVDGQVSSDSIPTMTVDIYESGRRVMTGIGAWIMLKPAWSIQFLLRSCPVGWRVLIILMKILVKAVY